VYGAQTVSGLSAADFRLPLADGNIMRALALSKAFTLIESGPVVLVSTHDGKKANVMAISWTMVMDYTPLIAITTGPWNYSFAALKHQRECVLAIPGIDMLDTVVKIGTCSGADTDKFARFRLNALPAEKVGAPLIGRCLANIECQVVDIVEPYGMVVLQGVAAHVDVKRKERRTIHAVGDGSFIADGHRFDRRKAMASKLAPGVSR